MFSFGGLELLILLFVVAFVAIPAWAIVDALRADDIAWASIGQNKTLWVALIAGGTFFGGLIGVVLAVVYLASIRPKLAATGRI